MINKVSVHSTGDAPVLLSFHQGLGDVEHKNMQLSYSLKGEGKKRKRIVSGVVDDVTYNGTDFGADSLKLNSSAYAVGMLDESTGELSVVPADHIFVMQPAIKKDLAEASSAASTSSHFERKQQLAVAFGSSKKIRAINAAQSNVISVENIAGASSVQSEMKSSSSSTQNGDEETVAFVNAASDALNINRKLLLPEYNLTVTKTEDVYPITGMIPRNIQSDLDEYFTENIVKELTLQEKDLSNITTWNQYVQSEELSSSTITLILSDSSSCLSSKKGRKSLITKCLYLTYMITFYVLLTNNRDRTVLKDDILGKLQKENMNTSVLQHITDSFSAYKRYKGKPAFCATKANL